MSDQEKPVPSTSFQVPVDFVNNLGEIFARKLREVTHSVYSNTANFELNEADLKILFGQTYQSSGKTASEWHTAVTMSWPQAKLFCFFLRSNIAIYEANNGAIRIPRGLTPAEPPSPSENEADTAMAEALNKILSWRRELIEERASLDPRASST
jgi:hypothetical protein